LGQRLDRHPRTLHPRTLHPELFTPGGGSNLSRYDDAAFNKQVEETKVMSDLAAQGKAWAELDAKAMKAGTMMPLYYYRQQRIVGSKVGGAHLWAPYGGWGYPSLHVVP
jgi:ABC-type transport system substrate-binding protein